MRELTDLERAMLAFEGLTWRLPGSKDAAIRDRFGLTPTRYYQLLRRLLDEPAALAAQPMIVNRLRGRLRRAS